MSELHYLERPATAPATRGLLILHHGRGSDDRDLLPLARALDPEGHLQVVTPRGPLRFPGWPGFHWYQVPEVGYPDPETFQRSRAMLADLHDELWARTGIPPERTVLGGFSMGAVMSLAMALSKERPAPAGVLALSGFLPTVPGWQPSPGSRMDLPVFISHGTQDPVIDVAFARAAEDQLREAGLPVTYHEFAGVHQVDPTSLGEIAQWLAGALGAG